MAARRSRPQILGKLMARPPLVRLLCRSAAAALLAGSLGACDPISLTMLGVGAGAGVAHQMGGVAYKTFSAPLPRVRQATLSALSRMAIKPQAPEKTDSGQMIRAKATDRSIEIELESLTTATTRIKVTVKRDGGLIMDSATAVEIIVQTEKMLGNNV